MPENSDCLTHLDDAGRAHIVDVSEKAATTREATARACVRMQATTLEAIVGGDTPKGDVLAVARIAGIQAAKKCSELIPLCHPLPLSSVFWLPCLWTPIQSHKYKLPKQFGHITK